LTNKNNNLRSTNLNNKIAIIVSTPFVIKVFLVDQINEMAKNYDVTIILNLANDKALLEGISDKINVVNWPIERKVRIFSDLRALFLLGLLFYKGNFSLVHSVSPKAGLLCAIASWMTRIPNRLHTFTGQVWSNKQGISRWLLILFDKIISTLDNTLLVDSFSQQDFLIKEHVLRIGESIVLGSGSICGVNLEHFKPSKRQKIFIRNDLRIKDDCLVFLFVGRLNKDKGLMELIKAFKAVNMNYENLALLIIGPDEQGIKDELIEQLGRHASSAQFINFTNNPEKYMMAADIFIIPSYREGFGNVVIEAAACGIPAIGSNIYGLTDAIIDGETGLLVQPKSSKLLEEAMVKLIVNDKLRYEMGLNARNRVIQYFSRDDITLKILKLYKKLIKN
jgi:glycosyltransferase involved in cell wall biosynthesis